MKENIERHTEWISHHLLSCLLYVCGYEYVCHMLRYTTSHKCFHFVTESELNCFLNPNDDNKRESVDIKNSFGCILLKQIEAHRWQQYLLLLLLLVLWMMFLANRMALSVSCEWTTISKSLHFFHSMWNYVCFVHWLFSSSCFFFLFRKISASIHYLITTISVGFIRASFFACTCFSAHFRWRIVCCI